MSYTDEERLAQLGYKQELHRGLSGFSNFAVSFSIISVLAGCLTSYGIAMKAGGPVAITLGWLLVGGGVILVALSMAEVCSAYPTAGALYWWTHALAKKNKSAWSWFVGWFNFVGEFAVTAAIDYGAAMTLSAFLSLTVGLTVTPLSTFGLFLVIIIVHGLLNTFGVSLVRLLSDISAWWHLVGVAVIVGVLVFVPDQHKSLGDVFTESYNATGWTGPFAAVYAFLMGLLMAQYTFTGYDASAHVAEETKDAARTAPRGIVSSVVVSLVAGFVLLVAVTAAIQDYDKELAATATGFQPAEIFIDAVGANLGKALLFIIIVAQFFCGMASVTANSRMAYAFARDGALPGSRLWKKINPRTGTPTNSIWLCVACSVALLVPAIWTGTTGYLAATSVAVIGLYISYITPVFLRLRNPNFPVGPWNLGRWSKPVGWLAVLWTAFIVVLFLLPPAYPITVDSFNYAPVTVLIVLGGAILWWFAGARRWFTGPRTNVDLAVAPKAGARE
ncbi:amino acid permease [Longispora sp. K20-0274]|uniref:amino acid permease n=1 Tax=Longispora sp. K20-0274 TaxID=3088255 RepID=UPI0039995829